MSNDPFAGLPAPIRAALERRGFTELTLVQQAVVSARADGRDLRLSSQTGSGKTVAIGLALADHIIPGAADAAPVDGLPFPTIDAPTIDAPLTPPAPPAGPTAPARPPSGPRRERGGPRTSDGRAHPTALVIAPTRELAVQVGEELTWLYEDVEVDRAPVRVDVVTGGTSVMSERRALACGPRIVVGTPGRLLDHLRNEALATDAIEHVVLDEADRMLEMGFREELDAILETMPAKRSSHLVSATFPRGVRELADRFQNDPLLLEGTRLGVANADIQHIGYAIQRHETYAALVNILLMAEGERCLLFVNTRQDATDLAEKLATDGFGAAPMSGELAQAQRTRTLAAFRSGSLPILVSTEVAARGLDVPGISNVIHVDPPREADAYTHRSGRTGRAGETGRSLILVTPPDLVRVERMLRHARIELSWQPVPTPAKVEKALRKRDRRRLHALLAEQTPEESQWLYAKSLLEDRDPVQVVATLLDLTRTEATCPPMEVVGFDPKARPARRPAERERRDGGFARGGAGARAGARGRDRVDAGGFTRFFVAWGRERGATPSRLLSQVCRRGGISSDQVGSIEIAARVSFVDVAEAVAADFEAKVRTPDARDRGIAIRRAEERGPRPRPHGDTRRDEAGPHPKGPKGPRANAHRKSGGKSGGKGGGKGRGAPAGPRRGRS